MQKHNRCMYQNGWFGPASFLRHEKKLFKYRRIEVEVLHTVATKLLFFFQGWIFVWCVCSSGLVLLIKKGLRLKQEICMV